MEEKLQKRHLTEKDRHIGEKTVTFDLERYLLMRGESRLSVLWEVINDNGVNDET